MHLKKAKIEMDFLNRQTKKKNTHKLTHIHYIDNKKLKD